MATLAFRQLSAAARAPALAASLLLLLPGPVGAAPGDLLELADDRGEPLGAAVELCFVEGLGTECVGRVPGDGSVELPASFDLLRVEGPEHGPVSARRRDLPAAAKGVRRLAVPRKALLRVRGAGDQRLTAALRPLDALDAGRPAHGLAVPAAGELRVPAGEWLLSLEGRGAAPDLHLLSAAPGSAHTVRYRPRAGWSLVLRAAAKEGEAPVAGARVSVRAARPVGYRPPEGQEPEPEVPPRTTESGAAGLALISGIEDPVVDVALQHPDFVEVRLPGLSSTPGTLEVRDAALGKGATLEATVRVDGEPAAGWHCALLDRSSPHARGESLDLASMEADGDGVCRGEKLPEGFYWLRVTAPDEAATAEREVQLYDGEAAALDFDLSPIGVEGEAFRGREPVPAHGVTIYRLSETGSSHFVEPVAETVTDEDGAYETTLWDAGRHSFHLLDPEGRWADTEHADVQPPSVRVDFHLAPGDVEGLVVDEAGEPVAGAGLMARWEMAGGGRTMGSFRARDDGTFRLPLEAGAGTLELTASHDGFRPETVRLPLAEDAVPPPIVLTLRRGGLLEGRLVTSAGTPAAGATIQSFAVGPDGGLERRGSGRTDAEGRFELLPAEPPPTRLVATGPGCPITAADVTDPSEPVLLTCPGSSGTLLLRFMDTEGRPVAGEFVLLRHGDLVISFPILAPHLSLLGQSLTSDGSGRLVIPGLPPGGYDVYLLRLTTEVMAAQGRPEGHAGSVTLLPGQTAELEVLVEPER